MPPPIFAHLGHWYVSLPVFMGPALLLIVALKVQTWRERQAGPESSGKYSSVLVSQTDARTVVAVSGPLDYPALVEIEVELGRTEHRAPELLLDLRGVTRAEEDSAWNLCDALGRGHLEDRSVSVLVSGDPAMRSLTAVFAAEGIQTTIATGPHTISS